MRCYFFGDIHGNLPALERCLLDMEETGADEAYCLGDLVGWLPFGNRTLSRMRSLAIPTVAGNHDLLVAGLLKDHPEQLDRMQASAYNAGVLSATPDASEYLLGLPLLLEKKELLTVVHHSPFHLPETGAPPSMDCFNYLDGAALEASLERWRNHPHRLIVSGHDHIPAVYELPDTPNPPTMADVTVHRHRGATPLTVRLKPDSRYWVKTGSVGGPYRDGVPLANSALYDSAEGTLTLSRLEYPKEELRAALAANRFFQNIQTIRRTIDLLEK